MADVRVINPNGELVEIAEQDLPEALQKGFTQPSPLEEYELATHQKAASGVLNPVKAGLTGILSTLTGGGTDTYLKQIGLGPAAKTLEEANPGATAVGQIAGAFVPSLIPGLGEVTAPGLISHIGEGTTKALGTVDLAPVLGKTIAKYAPKIAGSAVEGAFYGGLPVSEDVLGDAPMNGEKLVANIGLGALIGGAIPTALAGLKGLGSLGAEYAPKLYSKAAGIASGVPSGDIEEMLKQPFGIGGDEGPETRSLITPKPEVEHGVHQIYNNISQAHDQFVNGVYPFVTGKSKDAIFKRMIDEDWAGANVDNTEQYTSKTLVDLQNKVRSMIDGKDAETGERLITGYGYQVKLKNLFNALQSEDARLTDYVINPEASRLTPGDMFNLLDRTKQNLGDIVHDMDLDTLNSADRATVDALNEEYGKVKKSLENQSIWGDEAGQAQKELNQAWKKYLNAKGAIKPLFKDVGAPTGFGTQPITKSKQWTTALRGFGKPENQTMNELIHNYLDAELGLSEVAEQRLVRGADREVTQVTDIGRNAPKPGAFTTTIRDLTPADRAFSGHVQSLKNQLFTAYTRLFGTDRMVARTKGAIDQMVANVGSMLTPEQVNPLFDKLNAVRSLPEQKGLENIIHVNDLLKAMDGSHGIFPHIGLGGYGTAGFLMHGIPGLELGATLGLLSQPATAIRTLAAMEKMFTKADAATKGKVKQFIKGAAALPSKREVIAPAVLSAKHLSYSPDQSSSRDETQSASVQRIAGELAKFTEPNYALDKVTTATEALHKIAPQTAQEANKVMVNALAFLQSKAPAMGDVQPWETPSLSRDQVDKFARYLQAIEDPHSVLDGLVSGSVSREGVEALEAVYPQLLQSFRQELLSYAQDFGKMTYQDRINMSTMLGAALDKSLRPEYLRTIAASVPPPKLPPPPAKNPKSGFSKVKEASRHQTDLSRIENE